MHRRTFITLAAGAIAGLAFGVHAITRSARPDPGPRYLARHESGVWGITDDPAAEEGVWIRHPSGVLGIAEVRGPAAAERLRMEGEAFRMVMTEEGVVGVEERNERN